MECLFCEVFLAECLQVCRSYFATLCDDLLHLERPPRESFNRWVMDYFSVASCPMDDGENFCSLPLSALRKASSAHSLVPETLYDETQHMLGCCQNIASNGIGSHLFWELLDDLPFPIHLPPLSRKKVFPSTHQKRTEIKRVRRKPPTHTLFIDASQPQSSASKKFLHTNRKPFGLSRNHCKPPLSSLDIYDSLAYTVALLLRRSISECDHTSSRVASQLRYLLYGVVSAKEDSSCCFALEWMSLVLSQLSEESTEPQKPISLYERTWVKELVARGYLRLPKKTPFTTLENESTSPTDQSPTFYDPFIISLLFSLRALKRPVLIDRFAEAVIRLYCRLERFFVQVLVLGMHKQLAVTRHVHTKTWAILADKPFLHDAQTYTLCGTYICHSRNAEKIQCTPVQLIETLSESSRQDHCCVVLVWATAHVKNAYLVVRVNLSTMRRSWKRYLRTDERDRTDVVSSFAVPFLGRLTKMILRYKALTGPEEGGRGLQVSFSPRFSFIQSFVPACTSRCRLLCLEKYGLYSYKTYTSNLSVLLPRSTRIYRLFFQCFLTPTFSLAPKVLGYTFEHTHPHSLSAATF